MGILSEESEERDFEEWRECLVSGYVGSNELQGHSVYGTQMLFWSLGPGTRQVLWSTSQGENPTRQ